MLILISYIVHQGPREDQLEPGDAVDQAICDTMAEAGCTEVGGSRIDDTFTMAFNGPRLSDAMKERLLAIYPKLTFKVEYTPVKPHPENPIAVEVSVTNINERGVFLTVKRYGPGEKAYAMLNNLPVPSDPTILGVGMTPEEVFEHTNWIVTGYTHHFDKPIDAVAFNNPRKAFDDLKAIEKEITALYSEESMSNGERYKELSGPYGLVRLTKCRRDVLRLVAQVTILSLTGMWPNELDRLGL